jgi:hypothetical protein
MSTPCACCTSIRLREGLSERDYSALVAAADRGDTEAVRLMLELGFPIDTHAGPDAATALHAAARAGSAEVVRILVDAGADIEARGSIRNGSALSWAVIGQRPAPRPQPRPGVDSHPARPARRRRGHGASVDRRHVPDLDVARVLSERGINVPGKDVTMMRHSLGLDR